MAEIPDIASFHGQAPEAVRKRIVALDPDARRVLSLLAWGIAMRDRPEARGLGRTDPHIDVLVTCVQLAARRAFLARAVAPAPVPKPQANEPAAPLPPKPGVRKISPEDLKKH